MASISQLTARLVDLFGSPVTANPAKLLGNLGVSPAGNVLVGTSTDDGVDKLQVNGATKITGNVSAPGYSITATNYYNSTGGAYVSNTNNSVGAAGGFHQTSDIGMGWASWSGTGTVVVQQDAPNAASAYVGMRWTDWGHRHVAAIAGYEGGTTSTTCMVAFLLNSAGSPQYMFNDTGNATFAGTLTQNSDYRIKSNVVTVEPKDALTGVLALRPVTYDRIDEIADPDEEHIGFIAHEIQEVFPLLVTGEKDAVKTIEVLEGDKTPYKPGTEPVGYVPPVKVDRVVPDLQSVNYVGMVPYLVAAIQELKRDLDELRSEIATLKGNQ